MQFNAGDGQSIVDDIYFEVGANSVTYPIADIVRNANAALDNAVTLILGADGRWQFDSSNATDLPIGTTDIISGQQDYSFNTEYLILAKPLECWTPGNNWIELLPVDKGNLNPVAGIPYQYNKLGSSFLLDDIPNYNCRLAFEGFSGLRAYFQRKIDYFTISDTTKEPGFAKHLHKYVSLYCAYVYALANNISKSGELKQRMLWFEGNTSSGGSDIGEIKRFYSYREKDVRQGLRANIENTR